MILLRDDNKVLLGKRKGSHGAGTWSFPGGHLEPGESFEDCCRRETLEETGIKVGKLTPVGFTNDIFEEEKLHYVTLYFMSEEFIGEPKVMEPDKCEEWDWFALDLIPGESMLLNSLRTLDQRHLFMALTGSNGMICIPVSRSRSADPATERQYN
jgi:8-oxo-dGTP diphosphatase